MSEFIKFPKMERLEKGLYCIITEKIHGSHAQILIDKEGKVIAGSRTRWLTPGKMTDNYGFAQWVIDNSCEIAEKLGPGRHYGEFYGQGINSGYNLKEKRLVLFNHRSFPANRPLPKGVDVIPVLYMGPYSDETLARIKETLTRQGSALSPGFMKPEGVVINFPALGHSVKYVFSPEETGWTRPDRPQGAKKPQIDISPYLQPIRLEKLLSRDSVYLENYPKSLPSICKDYLLDLQEEGGLEGADEMTTKLVKQAVFPWIKEVISLKG